MQQEQTKVWYRILNCILKFRRILKENLNLVPLVRLLPISSRNCYKKLLCSSFQSRSCRIYRNKNMRNLFSHASRNKKFSGVVNSFLTCGGWVRFQRLSVALQPVLNNQSWHTQQNKIKGKQRKPKTVDIVSEAKYEYYDPGASSKVYFRLKLDWQQTPINNLSRSKTLKKTSWRFHASKKNQWI